MAAAVRTPASVAFCEDIVEKRFGLGLIGAAFSALPPEARLLHVGRLLEIVLSRRQHPVASMTNEREPSVLGMRDSLLGTIYESFR